jgi:hypothetical protein
MDVNFFANLIHIATNPVSLGYLGLAAVYLVIMLCYLRHQDGRPLAACAGLASALYAFLALMHSLGY